MNRKHLGGRRLAALLALLSLAGIARAQQEATFFVPIHLTNLPPEVTGVSACCVVPKTSSGTAKSSGMNPAQYSCSQQQLAVSGGSANGELAVSAPVHASGAHENSFQYECQARLTANINGTRVFLWPANGNAPPTRSGKLFVYGKAGLGKTN